MNIPTDPAILLSFINTKLRDEFPDLDELCKSLCTDREAVENKLAELNDFMTVKKNRFI